MKPDTKIWLRCESVGRPEATITKQLTVREAIKEIAAWLLAIYMGQKIRIAIAREESGLATDRRSAANQDIMDDLESILGPVDQIVPRETLCDDERCANPEPHEQGSADCSFGIAS
jgi:hypothetical protein